MKAISTDALRCRCVGCNCLGCQRAARDCLARTGAIRAEQAIVPALWWYELRNVLVLGERRGRLTERDTARFLRDISRLAVAMDSSPDEMHVLTLARRHRLTVYDVAYLELAWREALPLATLDQELAAAAQAEQVALIG